MFIVIGQVGRVFANGQGTWVQSQVKSYQRLKKWYLMSPCLTLNIKVRIKGKEEHSLIQQLLKWYLMSPCLTLNIKVRIKGKEEQSLIQQLLIRQLSGHPRLQSSTLLTNYIHKFIDDKAILGEGQSGTVWPITKEIRGFIPFSSPVHQPLALIMVR